MPEPKRWEVACFCCNKPARIIEWEWPVTMLEDESPLRGLIFEIVFDHGELDGTCHWQFSPRLYA